MAMETVVQILASLGLTASTAVMLWIGIPAVRAWWHQRQQKSEPPQDHPWDCDMRRGDVQCPYVTPNGTGYLRCTWREGHPDALEHSTVYRTPNIIKRVWHLPFGGKE